MAGGDVDWGTVDFSSLKQINWDEYNANTCRSLVEVPGGVEWTLRRLYESHPQFCWKFPDGKIIAHYYFEQAAKTLRSETSNGELSSIPKFYATLPYFSSPFEISIQPRFLDRVREKLHANLVQFYSDSASTFEETHLFPTVPCALREKENWYRGQIVSINQFRTSAVVLLVDLGVEKIVPLPDLRPLISQFGRIPPLALKCRVKNVFINDLDTAKVVLFKELIARLNNTVRVEICSNEEPFYVNLFHPTVHDENIGRYFYRPADHAERENAKWKKWLDHKRRQANDNDSDFDDEDSQDDEEEEAEPSSSYIKSFARSPKIPKGVTNDSLTVVYVENSTIIFLRSGWMESELTRIESSLLDEWDTFPPFEAEHLLPGTACTVLFEGKVYRAVVEETRDGREVCCFLLDYGKYIVASMDHLRALPYNDPYDREPMVYVVSLPREFNYFPHPSEAKLLRSLLAPGSTVSFNVTKTRGRIPVIGQLLTEAGDSVDKLLSERLAVDRVDVSCREVLPFTGKLPGVVNSVYVHRLHCNQTLAKGNLSECHLSEF